MTDISNPAFNVAFNSFFEENPVYHKDEKKHLEIRHNFHIYF